MLRRTPMQVGESTSQSPLRPVTFATPEEAAVIDFPPQYVKVESVTYSTDRTRATVALLTNEEPYLYPYYVYCERDEHGRWYETHSSN